MKLEKIDELTKKIFPFVVKHFQLPAFDDDDIKQEIRYALLDMNSDLYDNSNDSNASFDTYAFKAVYNHFINLRQKLLYLHRAPCNSHCPFYVKATDSCCLEDYQHQCPYYVKYNLLTQSKLALAFSGWKYKDVLEYNNDIEEIVEDIIEFCKKRFKFSGDILTEIEEGLRDVSNRNDVDIATADLLKFVVTEYLKSI